MKKIIAIAVIALVLVIAGVKYGKADESQDQSQDNPAENQDSLEASRFSQNTSEINQDFSQSVAGVAMEEAKRIVYGGSLENVSMMERNFKVIRDRIGEVEGRSLYEYYKEENYEKLLERIKDKTDEL
jgi:hypothetical protein